MFHTKTSIFNPCSKIASLRAPVVYMNAPQNLYVTHNNAIFLFMEISRWENARIDIYSIPRICQPARKSSGIDFSGNRSLGVPAFSVMS